MRLRSILLASAFSFALAHNSRALSGTAGSNETIGSNTTALADSNCNILYENADSTGLEIVELSNIHSSKPLKWDFAVVSPGHPAADPSLNATFEANFWLGTPEGIDLYDPWTGYSGCAILIALPPNTIKRGQQDDGSCGQTLSPACAKAIEDAAKQKSLEMTRNLPIQEPTSHGPLDFAICEDIALALTPGGNWPAVCAPYFEDAQGVAVTEWTAQPITANQTNLDTCAIHPLDSDRTYTYELAISGFQMKATGNETQDIAIYDSLVRAVHPLLTVFFPQANDTRNVDTVISTSDAGLRCLRTRSFHRGSRVPQPLSAPDPIFVPEESHKNRTAGIVVVVLLLLLVAVGAIWWFWWRKRRSFGTSWPKFKRGRGYSNLDNTRYGGRRIPFGRTQVGG